MKKVYVLIGNYGSGKTELALNFAFRAAETGRTELLDLDMVNTYCHCLYGIPSSQALLIVSAPSVSCSSSSHLGPPPPI